MKKKLVLVALSLFVFTSCGKKSKQESPYTKDPSVPLVSIPPTDCPSCNDPDGGPHETPTPTPAPLPAPVQPAPAPGHHHHPHPTPAPHPAPLPAPVPAPAPAPEPDHPTTFCNKHKNGANYNETTDTSQGSREGYDFGYGGGCLHRPLREVLAVSLNRALMVWDEVDDSSFVTYSPPDHVSFFDSVTYNVHKIITVSWIMDWYYSVKAGDLANPQKILINYKKTKGTSHISYWEGSMILDRVNDNVTSFTMLNQITADQNTPQDAEDAVKDVFRKLHTGAPDWDKLR